MVKITTDATLNLTKTIAIDLFKNITYPFEALPKIGEFIENLIDTIDLRDFNKLEGNILIHKTAKVAPSAFIAGPCIIDAHAEIRHCAFIRGNAIVGKHAVVGNSTELKNVVLFDRVQVPHYNYVGDSILGYKAHMGAGSITSNVKSEKTLVVLKFDGNVVETGLKKFGAIIADNVEVGCNSVLNPGTIVCRNSNIYPLSSVRGVVPARHIYKDKDNIVSKRDYTD